MQASMKYCLWTSKPCMQGEKNTGSLCNNTESFVDAARESGGLHVEVVLHQGLGNSMEHRLDYNTVKLWLRPCQLLFILAC